MAKTYQKQKTSFKMLLLLLFLPLIKYSQINVNISHYDYIFIFLYVSSDFHLTYLCFLVVRCLMVYSVYLLCELYLKSLKYSSLFYIKIKVFKKKIGYQKERRKRRSWSANTLATWCEELIHWNSPDAGKDWRQEEKWMREDEMVG